MSVVVNKVSLAQLVRVDLVEMPVHLAPRVPVDLSVNKVRLVSPARRVLLAQMVLVVLKV